MVMIWNKLDDKCTVLYVGYLNWLYIINAYVCIYVGMYHLHDGKCQVLCIKLNLKLPTNNSKSI